MSDIIRLAFAHPEERAAAMAGDHPRDRLSLRDYVVTADIGAFQDERGRAQRLRFNVAVEVMPAGPVGDDVDRILSYDRLIEAIGIELAQARYNLVETLAENIAARILSEPQAERVFLRIEKLDRGPYALGVEIVRRKGAATVEPAPAPRPVIAHFERTDIEPAVLTRRLDELAARGDGPVVLTVGLPDLPRPRARNVEAQWRIDLLAVEQGAWALAALDSRLRVAASRTELDWALRNGGMIVWAPGKMALDVQGAPGPGAAAIDLAAWLAAQLDALRLVVHGQVSVPAACRVPVEIV